MCGERLVVVRTCQPQMEAAVRAPQVQRLVGNVLRSGNGLRDLSLDDSLLRISLYVVLGASTRDDGRPPVPLEHQPQTPTIGSRLKARIN
jgi:hypothetical protein